LGCLLTPSAGQISLDGQRVNFKNHRQLTSIRRSKLGFVFQHSQLLPFMSVAENLRLVGKNAGMKPQSIRDQILILTAKLGISELLQRRPGDLSGGQRQRVSIARALLHGPSLILADEPTAALDWENGSTAMQLLVDQAKERGAALITVSHDTRLVDMFDRVLTVSQGEVIDR
ncbi:MAG: ATP-binding cassette domain-containing protein, partial [Planctomycetaceae bacterium]|nr:ATP-binding cassette domain-containing protein [Planctomycetaceae bacterium]